MRHLIFSSILALSIFSAKSLALPIQNADAFAIGDGKAIYDTASGLTWLDFGINNGPSLYTTLSQLDEGQYPGWRLPSAHEVLDLFSRLLPQLPIPNNPEDTISLQIQFDDLEPIWGDIFLLWGKNSTLPDITEVNGRPRYAFTNIGIFLSEDGQMYEAGMREFTFAADVAEGEVFYGHIIQFEYGEAHTGFYEYSIFRSTLLVRDRPLATVSEPTSLALLLIGILLTNMKRYRRPI